MFFLVGIKISTSEPTTITNSWTFCSCKKHRSCREKSTDMSLPKYSLLPFLLLLVVVFVSGKSSAAEGRPLALLPQQGYAKVFGTLGIVCECCDGGECTSTWTGSCSKLTCLPWKQH
ncbi:unnamed protein product [Malus baccata var. baccata]